MPESLSAATSAGALSPPRYCTPAEVAADKLSGIDYQYSTVLSKKPEWVTEAHAGGIEVNAWTVNSTADMMACIALGVDYITTDNPATLKKLLETPFVTAPK